MKQFSSAFVAEPLLLEELERRSTPIALGEDRVLFREGDRPTGVYIIWKGTALLTRGSNGETVMTVEAPAGSLLGLPAVVGTKTYSLTAVAQEDAEKAVRCGGGPPGRGGKDWGRRRGLGPAVADSGGGRKGPRNLPHSFPHLP